MLWPDKLLPSWKILISLKWEFFGIFWSAHKHNLCLPLSKFFYPKRNSHSDFLRDSRLQFFSIPRLSSSMTWQVLLAKMPNLKLENAKINTPQKIRMPATVLVSSSSWKLAICQLGNPARRLSQCRSQGIELERGFHSIRIRRELRMKMAFFIAYVEAEWTD